MTTRRAFLKGMALATAATSLRARSESLLAMAKADKEADKSPLIGNIREVTVSTDRLDESVQFYRKYFGYEVVTSGDLNDRGWQEVWQLPRGAAARAVVMRVPGHEEGGFRLVEFRPPSHVFVRVPFRPLDTGHAGCDMTVADLHARLAAMVDEGYNLASPVFSFVPPNAVARVTEAIALGPTCERLPMVYYRPPGSNEPEPTSPTFVPLVSAFQGIDNDIEEEAGFYKLLGLQVTRDRSFDSPEVNEAIGLPRDLRFRSIQLAHPHLSYGRVSLAQFFNHRGRNVSDRSDPPNLGILMISFRTSDMSELLRRLKSAGARIMGGPKRFHNAIYGSAQAVTVKRPNGAWIEFYT